VNNPFDDCGEVCKPKLFIRAGHSAARLTGGSEIVKAYLADQMRRDEMGREDAPEIDHLSNLPPTSK
jgi:hypothetical protein